MVKKSGFSAANAKINTQPTKISTDTFLLEMCLPHLKSILRSQKVSNICYKTQDPRISRKSLTKAVHDYNQQVRALSTAETIYLVKRPLDTSGSGHQQKKEKHQITGKL